MTRRQTLRSLAANPGVFAEMESAHDERLLNELDADQPDDAPASPLTRSLQIRLLVQKLNAQPLGVHGPTDGALARHLARLLTEWADSDWKGQDAA